MGNLRKNLGIEASSYHYPFVHTNYKRMALKSKQSLFMMANIFHIYSCKESVTFLTYILPTSLSVKVRCLYPVQFHFEPLPLYKLEFFLKSRNFMGATDVKPRKSFLNER